MVLFEGTLLSFSEAESSAMRARIPPVAREIACQIAAFSSVQDRPWRAAELVQNLAYARASVRHGGIEPEVLLHELMRLITKRFPEHSHSPDRIRVDRLFAFPDSAFYDDARIECRAAAALDWGHLEVAPSAVEASNPERDYMARRMFMEQGKLS